MHISSQGLSIVSQRKFVLWCRVGSLWLTPISAVYGLLFLVPKLFTDTLHICRLSPSSSTWGGDRGPLKLIKAREIVDWLLSVCTCNICSYSVCRLHFSFAQYSTSALLQVLMKISLQCVHILLISPCSNRCGISMAVRWATLWGHLADYILCSTFCSWVTLCITDDAAGSCQCSMSNVMLPTGLCPLQQVPALLTHRDGAGGSSEVIVQIR
jgi:hypothetical protein